jgi:hypothetical protein
MGRCYGARRCYPALQETDGHVHWPLGETVKPQLLPLPLGVAFITYWLGQVAVTFRVEYTTAGATMFTVTVQLLEPVTETLRLYQLLPDDPADSVAVHEPPPPPLDGLTVQVNVADPDAPVPSAAVAVTEYVPAVVGVPLIRPEEELTDSPGGSPLAE